jgi:hypothetical protein
VLAEARRLFPTKKVKYVVNTLRISITSPDWWRSSPEGITVITDDNNKFFVEAAFSEPRTLLDDGLARKKKTPKVEGVIDDFVLKDATRELRLHHVDDLEHSEGMLIAYLPAERILFTRGLRPSPEGTTRRSVDSDSAEDARPLEDRLRSTRDGASPRQPDHLDDARRAADAGRALNERTGVDDATGIAERICCAPSCARFVAFVSLAPGAAHTRLPPCTSNRRSTRGAGREFQYPPALVVFLNAPDSFDACRPTGRVDGAAVLERSASPRTPEGRESRARVGRPQSNPTDLPRTPQTIERPRTAVVAWAAREERGTTRRRRRRR